MKIIVFGSTGFTGKHVVEYAANQGYEVSAVSRADKKAPSAYENVTHTTCNTLDKKQVKNTIKGADIVISCLGVGGKGDGKPSTVVSDSTRNIVESMEEIGITRLVAMSNVGAGKSGTQFMTRFIYPTFIKWILPIIEDKNRMEEVLRASKLDWTAVRFPDIIDGNLTNTRVDPAGKKILFWISASTAAKFMVDIATSNKYIRLTPSVSR